MGMNGVFFLFTETKKLEQLVVSGKNTIDSVNFWQVSN